MHGGPRLDHPITLKGQFSYAARTGLAVGIGWFKMTSPDLSQVL